MNERRMSLGNRVISLVLALVMVIGMIPLSVFSVFAAETTTDVSVTQQNIAKIENYAQNMLKNNFTVYGDVDWATEGDDVWKYFNGVMLRAFLMMGVNSDNDVTNSTGNALEYVSGYLDSSITEGTAKPSGYRDTELDSVPPARMLFFLLDSSVDADKYEASIHYVYNCLNTIATGHPYPYNGGNLLHKPTWEGSWEIGLDGVYMAQPFLLEYANAIDAKKIENKYGIDTDALRTQVYTRLIWVADNMATKVDTVNGVDYYLYNHGCKAKDKESDTLQLNGQYWGRGIGWYAAGLVDCIELMPAGPQKNELIARLPKLFDGMIHYQDTTGGKIDSGNNTGMWYNLVNGVEYTGTSGEKTSNELETSGTALMAYSLLKAYNNDWVTADTYKNAGLRAFNGIVNNKVTGSENNYVVGGIYQQSGVSATASDYGKYAYKNHEAKGTGPVIMAAVEANRAIGTAEKNVIGVVSAPGGMTVPVGAIAADLDYSNVKLTVVSNFGNVETNIAPYVSQVSISDTSSVGTATVTLYSKQDADLVLDTFTVTVVDPKAPITATGTVTIASDSVSYLLDTDGVTSADNNGKYIVVAQYDGKYYAFSNNSSEPSGNSTGFYVEVTYDSAKNTVSFNNYTNASLSEWVFSSSDYTASSNGYVNFTVKNTHYGNKTMYIRTNDNAKPLATSSSSFYLKHIGNGVYQAAKSDVADGSTNRALIFNGSAWTMSAEATSITDTILLFKRIEGDVHGVELSIDPNTVNLNAGATQALTTKVTVDGVEVDLSDCTITWASNKESVATVSGGTITAVNEGTATITATLSKAPVNGTSTSLDKSISVQITVNVTGVACEHTPNGEGKVTAPTCTNKGYTTYTCSECGAEYTADETAATGHTEVTVAGKAATCTETGLTDGTECSVCHAVIKARDEIPANGHSYSNGTCSVCGAEEAVAEPVTGQITTTITTEGTETTVIQWKLFEGTSLDTSKTYKVVIASGTSALKNPVSSSQVAGAVASVSISEKVLTFSQPTDEAVSVWTLKYDSENKKWNTVSNTVDKTTYYIKNSDNPIATSANTINSIINVAGTTTWQLYLDSDQVLYYDGTKWTKSEKNSTFAVSFYTQQQTTTGTGSSTSTTIYNADLAASDITMTVGQTGVSATKPGITVKKATDNSAATPTSYAVTYAVTGGNTNCITINSATGEITANSAGIAHVTATLSAIDMGDGEDVINTPAQVTFKVIVTNLNCEHTTTETIPAVAPTCSATGLTEGTKCSTCGTVLVAQTEVAKLAHTEVVDAAVAPTCTATGLTEGKHCSVCNEVLIAQQTVPALGHSYSSSVTTAPTCTTAGERTYTCANDSSHTYTEVIDALGHTEAAAVQENVVAATCGAAGSYESVVYCSVCNAEISRTTVNVPATGNHTYGDDGKCTVCGAVQSTVPNTDEYVIATEMVDGNYYLLSNSNNNERAALWNGTAFTTGNISVTKNEDVYTITPDTAYTLLLWEVKSSGNSNVGYFRIAGTNDYLVVGDSITTSTTKSNATEFTVDLSSKTIRGNSKYFKIEKSSGISLSNTAQESMLLYTPNSTSGGTTPDEPDTPVVSSEKYIHNFTKDGTSDPDKFYTFELSGTKSGLEVDYGDLTLTTGIKMNSKSSVSFDTTADGTGTLTLVFNPANSGNKIALDGGDAITIPSTGIVTITGVSAGSHTVARTDGESHLMYIAFTPDKVDGIEITAPGTLYIGGSAESWLPTHELQYVVRHNDEDVTTGYTIEWSVLDDAVVSVDESGKITGLKPGTTSVSAKVTMADDTVYNGTVLVTVAGPAISTTDEMSLMVDVDSMKTGTIGTSVYVANQATNNFTVGYLSSNEKVATVDENGVVTAVGVGTATIYTYAKTINDHTVYSGTPTVDTLPELYATTYVTVTQKEITDASLNTYDFIIMENASNDKTALHELLAYKEDVNGVIDGEEGIKLTITYNTGDTIVAKFEDANKDGIDDNYAANRYGLQIDLDDIDMTQVGIQFAAVTYTDANNNELFRDTIWIHVVEYDPKNYEGTVTQEANIRYQLDTDGIEPNYEYVIVDDRNTTNGTGIAFMNPDIQSLGSSTAAGNTIAIQTADGVETATIANDANATAWLFDSYNPDVDCPDGEVRTQLNASNSQRYVGPGEAQTQLIHGNVAHVYLETVNEAAGEYYIILGFNDNNQPYYLAYENGAWHASTTANTLYLYKKHADITDYGVNYDLYDNKIENVITNVSIPEGNVYEVVEPVITWGGSNTAAQTYTIVWSSSNPSVATVDQNGKVTALTPGTATITATLYDVDGFDVICNVHNMPYMTQTVEFEVIESDAQPKLVPDYLEIGQGSMPNLDKVNIMMIYGEGSEFDFPVDHNLLNFRLADATNSDGEAVGFDNTTLDTYKVPVDYGSSTYHLTIKVVEDPYAGREPADSIPGYPDAGSVRMEKIAQGVLDFATTGVTKIELKAAGVSTKNSVDVILIVDVSNSMGWSIDWFDGMSEDLVKAANDYDKGPAGGASGTDKLDLAMATADDFADILLNVPDGDNTITFVTFAGENSNSTDPIDSVRTPMVGVSDYSEAAAVFAATKFTNVRYKNGSDDAGQYVLTIGGHSSGDESISGNNRGNTNYDFAFGEAIDAIAALKAQYAAAHDGASYDKSGRQIQVVFMTDGAPSHYNNKKANGSFDTLWSSSETYTQLSGVTSKKASEASDSEKTSSMATWLTHMKNYNELATDLYAQADGFYVVGFDMAHGGFSFFNWGLEDMDRVLEGLVKNTVLPVTLAEDEKALNTYFTNLAEALAYPGTNAKVTDRIGDNFTLFSGAHMYSKDITTPDADDKVIMSPETLEEMQGMSFPITVASYRLVTAADVKKQESMTIILTDGSTYTGVPTQQHLGLRVDGKDNEDILETITFSADGTQAYSSVLGSNNNIMNDDLDKMIRTIDASTFTYTATISPIKDSDGKVTGYHADQENIIWKIDTIEDRELSMSYYAYLEGSLDNPREAKAGVYATNEFAYLEYIDVYGKYVKREYGVPQVAWGAGSVTVRFFLVNKDGEYVNRAGVTFTNPANRIFLNGRAHYEAELNNSVSFTAADALLQAGLAGSNILYDVSAAATVTNSTTANQGGVAWTKNDSLTNINNLLTYTDSSNGYFTSVVIDIPVVMTDLGESTQKMSDTTVVIDYSNSVQWDALSEAERAYDGKEVNNVVYTIELVGFAKYNPNADLKDYVQYANWPTTYATSYGTYGVVYDADGNATDEIKFTPKAMLSGADHVFAVFKFQNSVDSTDYHYMYKQVSVVPATVVHYETTGTMGAAFQSNINGTAWGMKSIAESVAGAAQSNVNDQYGKDESYNTCVNFAGGSSLYVENAGTKNDPYPYVKFTFTGTGIDIISKTDPSQGRVKLTLTGKNTGTKKSVMVLNKGVENLYQIPVISVEGLPFDTYEAEIVVYNKTTAYGGQFYLDAIVVYGSAQETEVIGSNAAGDITVGDMYVAAGESKPQIVEIRDILLGNNTFGDISASGTDINGAVYVDGKAIPELGTSNFGDYDKVGPNNEAYLSNSQAIAFKLCVNDLNKLPTSLDIGLKSVNGSTAKAVIYVYKTGETDTVPAEYTISSSTAMFYDILGGENIKTFLGQNNEFYVVIANKGEGILSVTDLKVGYGKLQGKVETKVNVDVGELTQATLKASAQVVSVTAANVENGAAIAYAMYTTSIVVVTGQDAQSIEIENSDGKKIAVSASFVDVDNGARRWRVLVRFVELGSDTYTVYGVGTDGQRHDISGKIDVVVRLFEESTTNN